MLRGPLPLFLLKACLCLWVSVRTVVPGRDGVSYLWMGESSALGNIEALWSTVFHPLYPGLIRMVLRSWPGLDVELAGQLVACGAASLAVFPLWALCRNLHGPRAAWWATLCYAIGTWFTRHPAECLSEGPFFLLVVLWAWLLARPEPLAVLAGLAGALAYLTRPEGAALMVLAPLWLWRGRRDGALAMEAILGAAPIAGLLPLGYAIWGDGFTLTPKAWFNWSVGAGDAAAGGAAHVLAELADLPGVAFEELGFVVLPLVVAGLIMRRPRGWQDPAWLLVVPFVLQCAVVPLLQSHHRFLAGFGVLLLPFAGVAAAVAWSALARRGPRWLPWLLPVALIVADARVVLPRNADREIERELGRHLGILLRPDETVASDMPRLVWFAGRRPPPPRRIGAEELLRAAADPRCGAVVWVAERTPGVDPAALAKVGLEPLLLPALLSQAAGRRGILVHARKRR